MSTRRVPVRYLLALHDFLRSTGVDTERLLDLAGIDAAQFDSRDSMLTPSEVEAFIRVASELTGRNDLGFDLGRQIKMNSHDLLGYGLMSCPNLDALLRMTARHYHLMVETWTMHYRRTARHAECVYTPLVTLSSHTMRFYLEALALAHHNQLHLTLGDRLAAYDIHMSMPEPAHIRRYRSLHPVRFHFEASAMPGVRVVMPSEMLDLPLALANEAVMRDIDDRCSNLGARPQRGDVAWSEYVTMVLRETRGATVTLQDIAQRVQVSARTIDRHLKKEGVGFRELADKVRFERACDMLCMPNATSADVAAQLGFSEPGSFTRAFRRVVGVTPGEYQKQTR